MRAGYQLEWITATDCKLAEFITRRPSTGTEIAVEAKSRHRPGVLSGAGETPDIESLQVDVAASCEPRSNYSWHWDGVRPAGNPMHFVVVPRKTVAPLPENEVI
jgi:hypothetical protein